MLVGVSLLVLLPCVCTMTFEGTLEDRFEYFEKVESSAVKHHVDKRAADAEGDHEKLISVDVLGRHFRLHLRSLSGLFSRNFRVVAVKGDKSEEEVFIDRRDFFTGYVEGEENSRVNAHWQGDTLAAVIHTPQDTFVVEPSWRHIDDHDKYSMIAYRFSDMKRKAQHDMGGHFCGHVDVNGTDHAPYDILAPNHVQDFHSLPGKREKRQHGVGEDVRDRYRRQSLKDTQCQLAIVADYKFFEEIGQSDITTTVKYMATVIEEADQIFEGTDFGPDADYGFEIERVIVHTEPTNENGHYNMQTSSWGTSDLLNAFSDERWKGVCLAHLFTHRAFSGGVLGLAWVAGPEAKQPGGICQSESGGKYYNTGWSSSSNSGGNRLTTVEAYLVTTHEFGHGWGSPHDPDTNDCAPSSGKYIMYTYSVNGADDNNFRFSSCSRDTIGAVLKTKSGCFVAPGTTEFCGNYIVESGEQCDPGFEGVVNDDDPCCTTFCTLRSGADCSDTNQECCLNCEAAPSSRECRNTMDLVGNCDENVFCDPTSNEPYECPSVANHLPNGTECGLAGECQAGVCLSACEVEGMQDCSCENDNDACSLCCSDDDGNCRPLEPNGNTIDLSDGTPCYKGYCDNGECKTEIRDLSKRLWDIIDDVKSFSGAVKFMRNNIVLSVVVLSLILYVPFVIIVLIIDWRRDKEDDEDIEWHRKDNDQLFSPKDNREVRDTYVRSRRTRGKDGVDNPAYGENTALLPRGESHASASGVDFH